MLARYGGCYLVLLILAKAHIYESEPTYILERKSEIPLHPTGDLVHRFIRLWYPVGGSTQ